MFCCFQGLQVEVQKTDGLIYEGILESVSSNVSTGEYKMING